MISFSRVFSAALYCILIALIFHWNSYFERIRALGTNSELERDLFMARMDSIHLARKQSVLSAWSQMPKPLIDHLNKKVPKGKGGRYSKEHHFLITFICKCASSTLGRMIKFLVPPEKRKAQVHGQQAVHSMWPMPRYRTLPRVTSDPKVVSMVVTRNPFGRIVSAYYNKVVGQKYFFTRIKSLWELKLRQNKDWRQREKKMTVSKPSKFLNALLSSKYIQGNCHFAPQYLWGKLYVALFDVYGTLETLNEDLKYFAFKTNLEGKLNLTIHKNPRKNQQNPTDPDHIFWKDVPAELIIDTYKLYFWDFLALNYSVESYFEEHGLSRVVAKIPFNEIAADKLNPQQL